MQQQGPRRPLSWLPPGVTGGYGARQAQGMGLLLPLAWEEALPKRSTPQSTTNLQEKGLDAAIRCFWGEGHKLQPAKQHIGTSVS